MASFPPDVVFDGSVSPVAPLIGRVALILAPNFGLLAPLPLQITPGQFLDVVHQTIQPPLHAHLIPAAQCEPAPALVVPDVAEHRTEGLGWTARMVAPVPRYWKSMASAMAFSPALAHCSSASPPGAPETAIAPRLLPPASITRPPPAARKRGNALRPLIGFPG